MDSYLKFFYPTSPGLRSGVSLVTSGLTKAEREKRLRAMVRRARGRSGGKVTVRHKGGGEKRYYRFIDFKRDKINVKAKVTAIEYDPNRSVNIARISYTDGEKRYILAPEGIKVGDVVESGGTAPFRIGNALPLSKIPLGTLVHNLEINRGAGGKLVRGAGTGAQILSREENGRYVQVKLPSGEVRRVLSTCFATIGELSNRLHQQVKLGKAGRARHLGVRPTVRGVAQNPKSHPHGGGEGRSGIGLPSPKTPWGKIALGKKTRRRTTSDKYIVLRRKK